MDPINILGLVDMALRTSAVLIKYAQDAHHTSADRKLLAEEAYSLSRLLERLRDRAQKSNGDERWLRDHKDLLQQFQRAFDDLAASLNLDPSTGELKSESRFKAMRTAAKWSFTKSEVYSLLERISRLQQHATMLLLDDQQSV